jgi:threonine/homoserine/homoserine lactone efflux protein
MPNAFIFLATAAGFGLAYAAAPGAVNTEAIRRGLARGARSTMLVELGSLIGDSLWMLLALTGVSLLADQLAAQLVIALASGCFLLRMAWNALHDAWLARQPEAQSTSIRGRGDFATGAFFGLANPVGLAFWSGLGSSAVALGATGWGLLYFFAGFFVGACVWCFGLSTLLGWGRRWVRPNLFRLVSALCGLFLGYLGLRLLWTAATDLLDRYPISLRGLRHAVPRLPALQ